MSLVLIQKKKSRWIIFHFFIYDYFFRSPHNGSFIIIYEISLIELNLIVKKKKPTPPQNRSLSSKIFHSHTKYQDLQGINPPFEMGDYSLQLVLPQLPLKYMVPIYHLIHQSISQSQNHLDQNFHSVSW